MYTKLNHILSIQVISKTNTKKALNETVVSEAHGIFALDFVAII